MKIGVYQGNGGSGVSQLPTFKRFLGRTPDIIVDFFAADTWQSMVNDAGWTTWSWAMSPYKDCQFVFSVPMCTSSNYEDIAGVAAGIYDSFYTQVFKSVAQWNFSQPVIFRIGWEANGGWYSWAASGKENAYAAAFQHLASMAKALVPNCQTCLCFAQGWQQTVAFAAMVPATVPDFIGWDLYAKADWGTKAATTAQVEASLNHNYSFDYIPYFMSNYPGAKFCVPEFGVGDDSDGSGSGDNADVFNYMFNWIVEHNAAWFGYWDFDAGDYNSKISTGERPNVAAAFLKAVTVVPAPPSPVTVATHAKTTVVQSLTSTSTVVNVASNAGWASATALAPIKTLVGAGYYNVVGISKDVNNGTTLLFATHVAVADGQWGKTVFQV